MNDLTLKQLRYFEALAHHRHFGKAAAECAITQPALSMQIQELEKSLGVSLVERSARELKLTGFGEKFLDRATIILSAIDELGELARASTDDFAGRLRIGVIPTIAPYLLPSVISKLLGLHPGLDIQVRETQTRHLINELSAGRLDTAVVALPVSEPMFEEVKLFSEEFVLVRSALESDNPVPIGEGLRAMKLLLLEEGHCFRDQALSFCDFNGGRPQEMLDASSLSTLVQMVGSGMGVTLIPEMAVPVETRSAQVSITRFEKPRPSRQIGMIWRKKTPLAKQLNGVAKLIKSIRQ